jgi:hypothetical protein
MAHVLRTCLLAVRLGRALGLGERQLADTYYTTLLRFVGCTADSHELLEFTAGRDVSFRHLMVMLGSRTPDEIVLDLVRFLTDTHVGGDIPVRVREAVESPAGLGAQIARIHCEVAIMLATRLGQGSSVCDALGQAFERWDGLGFPERRAGTDIPLPVRLAVVARDLEVLTRTRSIDEVRDPFRRFRDRTYDPRLVDVFLKNEREVLAEIDDRNVWNEVLRSEPGAQIWVATGRLDAALTAFVDFADVKTPFTLGHSRGVAALSELPRTISAYRPMT